MLMRVAVGIHGADIERVLQTYHLLSERYFTHASPTLFNAGTPHPQLSSCFLVCMKEDSIEGIYDTLKNCAMISKTAGGIGLSVHCIRATGYVVVFLHFRFITDANTGRTSLVLTDTRMALCRCLGRMMRPPAMLTREATNVLGHLLFT